MRIGVNLLPYSSYEKNGGAGVFIHNMVLAMNKRSKSCEHSFVLYVSEENAIQYSRLCSSLEQHSVNLAFKSKLGRKISEQIMLPRVLKQNPVDILLCNYYIPFLATVPCGVIVHDVVSLVMPKQVSLTRRLWHNFAIGRSLSRAAAILTVSHFSASEIERVYPQYKGKTNVCSEGVNYALAELIESQKIPCLSDVCKEIKSRQYILAVGHMHSAKNFRKLIEAFKLVSLSHSETKLVMTGNTCGKWKEMHRLVDKLCLKDRVVHLGYVSDKALVALYQNAACYCMPSLYEGFGLPLIEAQFIGCPIVCSRAASLPEVAGDGALYFDPSDEKDIAVQIETVLKEPEIRTKLIAKGKRNCQRYSWARLVDDIVQTCYGI